MPRLTDQVPSDGMPEHAKPSAPQTSHVVSFRLPETKYQELAQMSSLSEEGTPSELARELVCEVLNGGSDARQQSLAIVLRRLTREVAELQERVAKLASLLGH